MAAISIGRPRPPDGGCGGSSRNRRSGTRTSRFATTSSGSTDQNTHRHDQVSASQAASTGPTRVGAIQAIEKPVITWACARGS